MHTLQSKLSAIVEILKESNKRIEDSREAEETGFLSFKPEKLADAVIALSEIRPPPAKVLDLGCGNGQFALLAAAAGYDAYGIEINERLVAEAEYLRRICVERNLLGREVVCEFVAGDMIYPEYREEYKRFRKLHNENDTSMPISDDGDDPYESLGASPRTADIIYCWSWPTQSRFLYNFLAKVAKHGAVFVLPSYAIYTRGEHMNASMKEPNTLILAPLTKAHNAFDVFIGTRA